MIGISLFLLLLSFGSLAQSDSSFVQLLENGKAEFRKPFEGQDFQQAVFQLEKAVALQPEHSEALYYLGYAYSRLNCADARSLPNMRVGLCLKASKALERIPNPTETMNDDSRMQAPVNKIASEWGSLALSYALKEQKDSTRWALKQGEKRGGFYSIPRKLVGRFLAELPNKSIVFVSGDYYTFNLFYLQELEKQRLDVQVVDVSLLNTVWYPQYLRQQGVNFNLSTAELDSLQYLSWADSTLHIEGLTWEVPPSYGNYILRGDRLFLQLLKNYAGKRACCFSLGFPLEAQLGLSTHLKRNPFFDYIPSEQINYSFAIEQKQLKDVLKLHTSIPLKDTGQFFFKNLLRNGLMMGYEKIIANELDEARALLQIVAPYAQTAHADEAIVTLINKMQELLE